MDLLRTETVPLGPLAPVVERAKRYAAAARAQNTRRTYRVQWEAFAAWCVSQALFSLPASGDDVALYLTAIADEGLAPSTLDVVLAAISKAHELAGLPSPRTAAAVREVRSGIRRAKGTAPRQAAPLLVHDLRAAVAAIGDEPIGRRDRALLLLGFAGAFRRAELVALDVGDLHFTDQGLELRLARAKTDQEGKGRTVGVPFGLHRETCPVRAIRAWLEAAGITRGAVFTGFTRWGKNTGTRLSDCDVARVLKRRAAVGLDPAHLSGHSLRAGLATSAARAGKSERSIMEQTGHRSPTMVRRYIRLASVFDDNAADRIGL